MPSQSLTDEIEALADQAYHYNGTQAHLRAFRSRLKEIEKELTELRGMKETLVGWANHRPSLERTSALPCSNTIELSEDDGN